MNAFWEHLQRMARAQLFNGGYLAGPAIRPEPQTRQATARERNVDGAKRVPHMQVATCR
jgi:hypothetical protein